ncbi:acyl-CoA carboxylase epsilon subunit [Streptomyces sp. NPDC087866]|uniref:acyl-CoA carboxylase epsilon subunit n=1 Tax=unclassified Streptomyces TaxID=2593676 RepID=UPI0011CE880B|nr:MULTISPECIES: acyl-CoA carboxylase epsilon subunit [unclassified Streptomyces]MCX4446046.1 acyl-CoA carboxylase epsilon subunit [Streptomyces sp. NBC_01789]TXS06447.1 acyl-CoA carboxylase subunit epsilon [Streptomyces sp. col6]
MSAPALQGPLGTALFKVIRGAPSPEELAAVTALLTALTAAGHDDPGPVRRAAPAAVWDRPDSFPPASWMARP